MLCNVTEMAALVAVRRGATAIAEADIFQALEDSFYKRGTKDADVDRIALVAAIAERPA